MRTRLSHSGTQACPSLEDNRTEHFLTHDCYPLDTEAQGLPVEISQYNCQFRNTERTLPSLAGHQSLTCGAARVRTGAAVCSQDSTPKQNRVMRRDSGQYHLNVTHKKTMQPDSHRDTEQTSRTQHTVIMATSALWSAQCGFCWSYFSDETVGEPTQSPSWGPHKFCKQQEKEMNSIQLRKFQKITGNLILLKLQITKYML